MILAPRTRQSGAGGGQIRLDQGVLQYPTLGVLGKGNKMQIEKFTALQAYRAGKLYLPFGYDLFYGAQVLLLRRADGSVVATFSARGATPSEVARTAEADYRADGKSTA